MIKYIIKRYNLGLEIFSISKKNNLVQIIDFGWFQSRNPSMISLFKEAISWISWDFLPIFINTWDRPINKHSKRIILSFSSSDNFTDIIIPDFIYDCRKEAKIENFTDEINKIKNVWKKEWILKKIWRIWNCNTHENRWKLYRLWQENKNLMEIMHCDLSLSNIFFLSLEDLVKKYKYLIDIEGRWYSGRLKLLFFARRPIFIQDREYKDFLCQYLKPWENYIRVKNDLSDLEDAILTIQNNPKLEKTIINNTIDFAETYLTKEKAISYIKNTLQKISKTHKYKQNIYLYVIFLYIQKIKSFTIHIRNKLWKKIMK